MPIQLVELQKLANGAQFFTVDLHIHSYGASPDVTDSTMTVEAIVDHAAANGFGAIAITDHNSARNTQASIDYAQKYAGRLLVLAGTEVTTANGHLLVYFSPLAVDKLQSFLGKLDLVHPGTRDSHTRMSMADAALTAGLLGGVCIAAHIDKGTGFESTVPTYPNWKKDVLTSPYLFGVEAADQAALVWYSDDDERTDRGAERRKLLELRRRAPALRGRAELAHVQNSDAHALKDLAVARRGRQLTRLKMDELSFDSFRLALCDPEARVRAQTALPQAIPRIVGFHVQGGFLQGETYRLSDNLTCFIGGRGTGKSTALKCLSYGLGASDAISEYDNCPDSVIVYCIDAQGVKYKYERMNGCEPTVTVKEGSNLFEAPVDSFPIEYFGQGDLGTVAADPSKNITELQSFLDRHTTLTDLRSTEAELVAQLEENGSALRPLETLFTARVRKARDLAACDAKLRIAEEGQLKEIAAAQTALSNEKTLARTLGDARKLYKNGLSLSSFKRDFDAVLAAAGTLTAETESQAAIEAAREAVAAANQALDGREQELNADLAKAGEALANAIASLGRGHEALSQQLETRVAALQQKGLSGSIADLQKLVAQRGQLVQEIAQTDNKRSELDGLRERRRVLLVELAEVRDQIQQRRSDMVSGINRHLASSIDDYTTIVLYESTGMILPFLGVVIDALRGTYLQEETLRKLCHATTPQQLVGLVRAGDHAGLAALGGIGDDAATKIIERFAPLEVAHKLEVVWKPPRPAIRVLTKSVPSRTIPIKQLSDGQRHTIFLTIALLAESNVPLVIDQPEDDLDNAFIFSSVVRTLRAVKERRQVVMVTHNANIAVLGDAELLVPMKRSGESGTSYDSGSVDRGPTKAAVQAILEGGEVAFLRRKEMYGH